MKSFLFCCALVSVLFGGACAQSKTSPTELPDVLVLVLSGMGPVDQVSISYSSSVPEAKVKADIRALGKESGWVVRDVRVTNRPVGLDGARKTTSGSFTTLTTVNYKEGLLPVAAFVNVLKRFRTIQINYLVPEQFQFRGLKDFENEFVKLHLDRRGTYLYRITIKNNRFDRVLLPSRQPKAEPKQNGTSSIGRVAWVVGLALLCAFAAYLAARALYQRRQEGG